MAVVPGLPSIPFLTLGGGVGALGWRLRREALEAAKAPAAAAPLTQQQEPVEALLRVEPLAIEVGLGLVKIVDSGHGGSLLKRISGVRRQLAADLGFVLPPVRVTDNLELKPREYVVLLKGAEIARFELHPESTLAILPKAADKQLEGVPCQEPAFGLPALWVPQQQADKARLLGYTVVDPANVVATHLAELIRRHAHELMNRQEAQAMLDRIRDEHPKLVEDLVPKLLPLSLLQRVLQNLLRERVSIRDAVTILEALAEASTATKNPTLLTEFVRQALSRSLVRPYLNDRGELPAYLLDPSLEQTIQSGIEHNEQGSRLTLAPDVLGDVVKRIIKAVGPLKGPTPLLCSTGVRFAVRQIVETDLPLLAVLSHAEAPPNARIVSLGRVA